MGGLAKYVSKYTWRGAVIIRRARFVQTMHVIGVGPLVYLDLQYTWTCMGTLLTWACMLGTSTRIQPAAAAAAAAAADQQAGSHDCS